MSARSDKSKQAAGILRSGFNAEMLALLLFSILFVVLVRLDQDTHYVNLITERASFRGTPFSASRVLAPTLVRLVQSAGISILSASLLVDFLACAAGMFAFAGFVRQVCRQQVGLLLPATLLMLCLAANSIVLSDISYPDDLLAVLLFSAGLWAIASSHTGVYYFALVLGTLNRETAVYLVPSFLLLNLARYFEQGRHGGGRRRLPAQVLYLSSHALVSVGIWILIRLILVRFFSEGSPVFYENHLADNLACLKSSAGSFRSMVLLLYHFGGIWLLIPLVWRRIPRDLRLLLLLVPFILVLYLYFGNLRGEARVLSEASVLLAAAVAAALSTDRRAPALG